MAKKISKVAISSCYFQKNYGSALQALATQRILDEYGIENVTIRYDGLEPQIKKQKYKYYARQLLNPEIVLGKLGYIKARIRKKFGKSKLSENMRLRDEAIKAFEKNFRLSPKVNSFEELAKFVSTYDAVLVGSDQLWLTSNLDADYYTLNWVPDGIKRISYATSFGVSSIPKRYYSFASNFLKKIDSLSVREETGKQIVKDICGREATVICDPTIMFTGDQWLQIQKKEPLYNKKYIFCYFLGDNPDQRDFVKRLKKETGCDIVAILHLNVYVPSDEEYADYTPYAVDSADFINYIRNAEYVCTDSFHATVFSILNKKRFFTFRRFKANYVLQTNSRLDSLLAAVGLEDRILSGDADVQQWVNAEIDYSRVDEKLDEMRTVNRKFLENALGIEEHD